jgi:hypothetical protein
LDDETVDEPEPQAAPGGSDGLTALVEQVKDDDEEGDWSNDEEDVGKEGAR